MAKLAGCIVCGIAGSEEKCSYLKSIGADYTINYRNEATEKQVRKYFPEGIDIYFDNVGGEMLDAMLMNLRNKGRVVMCGAISSYNDGRNSYRLRNYSRLISVRGTMQGFIYFDYAREFPTAIQELMRLLSQNKLHFRFDMHYGLDECPTALRNLLLGKNKGKVIVRVNQLPKVMPKL